MRKSSVPIYSGDDMEQLALLRRAVDVAERKAVRPSGAPRRLGDEPESDERADAVAAAQAAYDSFVVEAAERAEVWVVESIGHAEFRDLLKAHPPRMVSGDEGEQVHDEDAPFGVNTDTFPLALLTFVDSDDDEIRTITEPALEPDQLRKRLKRLSAGEFDTLWVRAMSCNTAAVGDPKASLYSTGSLSTTGTSNSPSLLV